MYLKPNQRECLKATGDFEIEPAAKSMARTAGQSVFCTCSEQGILLATPEGKCMRIPGFPVSGPVDPVGAGDSTSAGIITALACGMTTEDAAVMGNLVASITVQQLGTTGTASPDQVRVRLREVV